MEKKREKKKKEWKRKKFNIFGDVWTIVFGEKTICHTGPEDKDGHWVFGLADAQNKVITVSTLNEYGKPLSDQDIMCSIAHECVHAILESGQYCSASNDEPMVEFLAKGILSLLKSKVFDYE